LKLSGEDVLRSDILASCSGNARSARGRRGNAPRKGCWCITYTFLAAVLGLVFLNSTFTHFWKSTPSVHLSLALFLWQRPLPPHEAIAFKHCVPFVCILHARRLHFMSIAFKHHALCVYTLHALRLNTPSASLKRYVAFVYTLRR